MKVLYYRNSEVIFEEVPAPTVGSGQILVRTVFSVVSPGSELFAINESSLESKAGKKENLSKLVHTIKEQGLIAAAQKVLRAVGSEAPLGYSSAGKVLAVGSGITDILPGDLVACMGMEKAVHGEIVSVPRRLVAKLPAGYEDLRSAAFGAIGCIGLNAVRKIAPQVGEVVVVYGTGLIGLMSLLFLKLTGARIIAIDPNPARREKALALGASAAYASGEEMAATEILSATSGRGADSVIVAAGASDPDFLREPIQLVRAGGKIILLGKVPANLDYNLFFKKDISLLISRSYGPGRYDPAYEERGIDYPSEFVRWTEERNLQEFLYLLSVNRLSVSELATVEVPFEKAPEIYKTLQAGSSDYLGIVLAYGEKGIESQIDRRVSTSPKVHTGALRAGIIGVGDFAKGVALPILDSLPDYAVHCLAARNALPLPRLAQLYRTTYTTSDAMQVIQDPDVDIVFILAPNNTHADFVEKCLAAGKPCFVEKPICITLEEQTQLESKIAQSNTPVFIGFNRRFAPLIQELMQTLGKLSGPTVFNYTVNAGFMDPAHWMQNPMVGGGRWISEGCHFVDLARFIIGSEVVGSKIDVISPDGAGVRAVDNYSVTLTFQDGSIGHILYTSLGAPSYPKEIIQVFRNGFVFEMRDFKTLAITSPQGVKNKTLSAIDKGHRREFQEMAKMLRGKDSLVPQILDSLKSNQVTLELARLSNNGKLKT